jgi:hypothetical protein
MTCSCVGCSRAGIALTLEQCNDDVQRCAEQLLCGGSGASDALQGSVDTSSMDSLTKQFASTPFALGSASGVGSADLTPERLTSTLSPIGGCFSVVRCDSMLGQEPEHEPITNL